MLVDMLRRLRTDTSGSYLTIAAIGMPVLLGFVGLGTEVVLWSSTKVRMQTAADNAALSGAAAAVAGQSDISTEARGVAANLGFVNQSPTTVTVNAPPSTGPNAGTTGAIEVIITQPQERLFSKLFGSGTVPITVRAVAVGVGHGCVLALDGSAAGSASISGAANVQLSHCNAYVDSSSSSALQVGNSSTLVANAVGIVGGTTNSANITTTNGIVTGHSYVSDPYAAVNYPSYSGCDYNYTTVQTITTLSPGVYCQGITLNSGANVTLSPGIYYIDRGLLKVNGGATLSGTGVTIVFTSSTGSNYATGQINGGATINLVAPSSGPTAGIAIFGDRNMPTNTPFTLNGGGGQDFGGAVYLPKASLSYSGNTSGNVSCTQVIANKVSFTGNSSMQINCGGYGTQDIGTATARLVE